ncbi:MAG: 4-hydroxy-tetrahydrodipicolinate synthase [Clostridia bacterium]|nr:4-hydroxy-tetrahydrodipicolinate synthase [Clostridia bacterium]
MKKVIYEGAGVALITPFKGEFAEEVDYDKLDELIEFQIANECDCIIICATTGEAATMPDEEHLSVAEHCVKTVAGRIPVVVGAGSNDTAHAIKLSKRAEKMGADAILTVTPYYNKTSQEGLIRHFSAIAASIDIPVMLYNVPGRTNLNIAPETYEKLCRIPNINCVKECNMNQVLEMVRRCGDNLNIYTGEDEQVFLPTLAGGYGVVSVLANFAPKYVHDMVMSLRNGDVATGLRMQTGCLELVRALFCEVNPMPVKEAMNQLGFNVGKCRMPLVEVSEEHKALIRRELIKFGALKENA